MKHGPSGDDPGPWSETSDDANATDLWASDPEFPDPDCVIQFPS